MTQAAYATREQIKAALDVKETARSNAQIDRVILSASRTIEGYLNRKFYPWIGTRYFSWPNNQRARPWRLWLDSDELISVTALSSGGIVIPATDYFLEPSNDGPPFRSIEIDLDSTSAFASNSGTSQRSIAITGVWGYAEDLTLVGELSSALDADVNDAATITWTDPAAVGVGTLLKIDNEWMAVKSRSFQNSGQDILDPLTANNNNVMVSVTTGSGFFVGETILVDAERMEVGDIIGNTLIVRRAVDGSVLASHADNADIYAQVGIQLERARSGSTLAAHTGSTSIYRLVVPPLINDLCLAEAMVQMEQEGSAYGRVVGSGETQREASGKGLDALRKQAMQVYGRRARHLAV